ncbi:MAG: shikimate kinase [Nitrososphaeria archaeon]|nr:shikimate kinase [Nitrososphaeria archaeon]NDB51719.1 shikimate kinase [Nitrosopumilaceae archaeon]NDB88582.1 shikimate kinase [Nitrososphaerota archaeon]NDB46474.1 shikimate kinase [Nitrososphaeria archaeon]NDB62515.1 shikimate kinase [Nitrosopumilaceae archaeon]
MWTQSSPCMLVITGNPGVGKHTIAEKLSEKTNMQITDLNQIAIQNKIFKKRDSALDVDVTKLTKIVKKTIQKNGIVVGHLAPYVLDKKQVSHVIILRKNPYKLLPVYKKRKYSQKKTIENIGSEILGITEYDSITRFGMKKTTQINTTNLTPNQIVNKIMLILKNKFKGDKVDWLDIVASKGDLAKFFPNKK